MWKKNNITNSYTQLQLFCSLLFSFLFFFSIAKNCKSNNRFLNQKNLCHVTKFSLTARRQSWNQRKITLQISKFRVEHFSTFFLAVLWGDHGKSRWRWFLRILNFSRCSLPRYFHCFNNFHSILSILLTFNSHFSTYCVLFHRGIVFSNWLFWNFSLFSS